MYRKVTLDINSNTFYNSIIMQTFSTVTQKGQVFIPKLVREAVGIEPREQVQLAVYGKKIIIEPVSSVKTMLGFIKVKKHFTEQDYARVVKKAAIERLKKKLR